MTDRYDDLLLKARSEMIGKHIFRQAPTHNDLFEGVWEGIVKNQVTRAREYRQAQERQATQQAAAAKAEAKAGGGFFSNLQQG